MPDPSIKLPVDTGEKTISGRTIWNNPETGEDYSERSTTFEIDGKYYTMPTVSEDGRQYSEVQIRDYVIENGPIDYLTGEELPVFKSQEEAIDYAIQRSSTRKQTDMAEGGSVEDQTEEVFGLDAFFGLDKPVNRVGGLSEKNAPKPVNAPAGRQSMLLTAEDKNTLADLTPIVGDLKGAYETVDMIADELAKEEPNYYVIGAMGGIGVAAAIIGLFPGLGDAAAKAMRKGAKSLGDVAKRVEVDTSSMGSGLGNVRLTPKKAANITEEPKIISFTKKKEEKELQDFYTEFKDTIGERAAKQNEVLKEVVDAGIFGEFQKGVVVQGKNQKGLLPFTVEGISLNKVKLNNPNLKRTEDQLNIKFNYIEKDGDYYLAMLNTKYSDGASGTAYLDAVKQLDYPIMSGPKSVPTVSDEFININKTEEALGIIPTKNVEPLEVGTSQFNIDNPEKVLKNHTAKELKTIDLTRSTAGGPTKNKLINAPVKENEEISVRLNLNSKIDPDGPAAPFNRLQTVHPVRANGKPNYSKADSYMPAVTVENGTFHVDQKKRRSIAEDGMKVPAMSVQGNFISKRNVLEEMDDTVVQIGANPKDGHLFVDKKTGQAVKSFEIATIYRDRVYAKGVTYWKKTDAPEPLPAKGDVPITNQVRYKFKEGGVVPMNNQMQQFAEGGLEDEGGEIDEVSGNEVPIGGTKEGVRDDIPANVSEGEFIFPADVVRFIGLDKLMSIRQDAKMGLKKMEAMGQMGNSDEATIDDDMPFGMTDLVVVGGAGEPMEFADGGFVPSYAPGGMVELQTADVPMTGDSTGEIDYGAYMNSVTTSTKEYRNAAGESVVITFINGVPTLPIPDGYTLYTPVPGDTVSPAGNVVAAGNFNTNISGNNTRQDYDGSEIKTEFVPEPINYKGMSDEAFAAQIKLESSGIQQFGRALGFGIASMVPFGMLAIGGGMRSHARKAEDRLNTMIEGASGEYKAELIATRDAFLKSYSLKPAALSNVFVAAADSYLMGKEGYTQNQVDAALTGVNKINNTNILVEDELSLVDIEPGKTVPLGRYDLEAKKLRPEGTKIQPESQSSTRARAIQLAENAFANGSLTREQADNRIQEVMQFTNIPPGESGDNKKIDKKPEYLGGNDLQGTADIFREVERANNELKNGEITLEERDDRVEKIRDANAADYNSRGEYRIDESTDPERIYEKTVYNRSLANQMKTVGKPIGNSNVIKTKEDAVKNAERDFDKARESIFAKRVDSDNNFTGRYPVLSQSNFGELATSQPVSKDDSILNYQIGRANEIQKQADDYYQTGAGMDAYTNPDVVDSSGQLKEYVKDSNKYVEEDFMDFAAPLAPKGKAFIQKPTGLKTTQQLADQRKNDDTARKLAAEEAAANAKQNSAFQNAANELFKNDNKEYRGGVLYSTAGKNAGKRINTAYMDAANLGTPNDDLKYVDGILRDKNGKGEAVNNAFQKMANLLTKSDGREYRGGKLIDEDTGYAYVDSYQNKDRSVDRNNPTGGINTSAEAMAANMAAFKQKFGSAGNSTNEDTKSGYSAAQLAAANQRNIAAGSATVNSRRTASDRANEAEQRANANAAVARSVRPRARPKAKPTARPKSRNFGGSSQVRAEGGLIQKPTTTKKPAKAKTNKRGLAARK